LSELRRTLMKVVKDRGLQHLPQPVTLASGALSSDFIDGKQALSRGEDLGLACRAVLEVLHERGIEFDAVGGLTLGADPLAHLLAYLAQKSWFVVRKAPKGRGTNKVIEGATITKDTRVLLVDDVVTTGGSMLQALDVLKKTEATVVAAIALVDRADLAAPQFAARDIPYIKLVSYQDLGIDPVRPVRDDLIPA
jgi:orotate phosphoribosyltransferase